MCSGIKSHTAASSPWKPTGKILAIGIIAGFALGFIVILDFTPRANLENVYHHQPIIEHEDTVSTRRQLDCDDMDNYKVANADYLPNYRSRCWLSESTRMSCLSSARKNPHFVHSPTKYRKYFKHLRKVIKSSTEYVRCLPYAFLAGFTKCGTTDLYDNLMGHPHILTTSRKEGHYWTKRRFKEAAFRIAGQSTPITYNQYLQFYDLAGASIKHHENASGFHEDIFLDGSASTIWRNFFWESIPENQGLIEPRHLNMHDIKYLMPDVKIIVIMRNPTDRLLSSATYFGHSFDPDAFHKSAAKSVSEMRRCFRELPRRTCAYRTKSLVESYRFKIRIEGGLYVIFIKEWLDAFPSDRFLFIRLEDYTINRTKYLNQAAVFLNLEEYPKDTVNKIENNDKISNSQRKHKQMLNKTRTLLDEFYAPLNKELAELLGDEGYSWS